MLRKHGGATLRSFIAALLCLITTTVHANGRLPGATGLAINPVDERELLVGLTFGLALTRDGGASWTWICERQIGGDSVSDINPSMVITHDGTLVVLSLTHGGVLFSRDDGCTFENGTGPVQGNRGADLTLDTSRPGHVLALMSTIDEVLDAGYPTFRNLLAHSIDSGATWEMLHEFPDDMLAETVEISASDPKRIYVSGTLTSSVLQGVIERSDDGGLTWKRTFVELPRGSGSLFISAIHPSDPNKVWFRVPGRGDIFGVDPTKLWLTTDGAVTFTPVAQTQAGMLGFALSPDGTRIAFGGPQDGVQVAPADASAAPTKVANLRAGCLRWAIDGLYACAGEPTDPFTLGFAADPMTGFVPLWHSADMCRAACAPPSTIEQYCSAPWDMIAPLTGAQIAMCGGGVAVMDAGVVPISPVFDAGSSAVVDASTPPPTAAPTATPDAPSSGCGCMVTQRPAASASWTLWLVPVSLILGYSFRAQRRRLASRRARGG